jgi:hypothetical protein
VSSRGSQSLYSTGADGNTRTHLRVLGHMRDALHCAELTAAGDPHVAPLKWVHH